MRPTHPRIGLVALAVLAAATAPALSQSGDDCFTWEPGALPPQVDHTMVFDGDRAQVLLYGAQQQLLARDGARWTSVDLAGPLAIASSVFDSQRGVLVLVSENPCDPGLPLQTWEWDGATWTLRAEGGPGVTRAFSLAYDAIRGVTVLFGGLSNCLPAASGQTWEWNGTNWSLMATTGPSARHDAAATFDPVRGVTVLFGGLDPALGESRDTWEWNGASWTQRSTTGPSQRWRAQMVYDESRARCVLFGGLGLNMTNATWEWNGSTWTSFAGTAPPVRSSHAMAYDAAAHKVVLVGGSTLTGQLSDTWERTGTTWTRVHLGPLARTGPAVAYDSNRDVVVMHGGDRGTGLGRSNETWEWSSGVWTQRIVANPGFRTRSAMTFDRARGVMVLFGGDAGGASGDTWEYTGSQWSRRATTGPAPRVGAAMAYDAARAVSVLYAGRTLDGAWFDDTWEWNGQTWTLRTNRGPNMSSVTMCYDEARGVCVAYGSIAASNVMQLWEYSDAAGWTRPDVPVPQLSDAGAIAYDRTLNLCVLTGFVAPPFEPVQAQMWTWNGAAWARVTPTVLPPARLDAPMCYIDSLGAMLITSGRPPVGGAPLGDTWLLGHRPVFTSTEFEAATCEAGNVTLDAGAVGGVDPAFQWQRETEPFSEVFSDLADGPTSHGSTLTGAQSSRLAIAGASTADEGRYRLGASTACGTEFSHHISLGVCRTDVACDGTIDKGDVVAFIGRWHTDAKSGGSTADFNQDGIVNSTDVSDFINAWFEEQRGCGPNPG